MSGKDVVVVPSGFVVFIAPLKVSQVSIVPSARVTVFSNSIPVVSVLILFPSLNVVIISPAL
ncbi:hypothetical protein [Mulberry dwarf phytoplasma]|uniref:hypothetical protein n=1 Tax=Mulberry dwarf phytoplasma TaxID=186171 RepID=UPI001D106561|nr:hypothetical protein [Mulberry dwarf phytoplasma]